jgi:hypothetical protein
MEQIRLQDVESGEVVFQGKLLGQTTEKQLFEKDDGGFAYAEKVGDEWSVEFYEDEEILCVCLLDCAIPVDDDETDDLDRELQYRDLIQNSFLLHTCGRFEELVERRRGEILQALNFMMDKADKETV